MTDYLLYDFHGFSILQVLIYVVSSISILQINSSTDRVNNSPMGLPGGPVAKTVFPTQDAQVRELGN